jgi:hypothetical protein
MGHFFIRAEMGKNAGRKQSEVDADYEKAAHLAAFRAGRGAPLKAPVTKLVLRSTSCLAAKQLLTVSTIQGRRSSNVLQCVEAGTPRRGVRDV